MLHDLAEHSQPPDPSGHNIRASSALNPEHFTQVRPTQAHLSVHPPTEETLPISKQVQICQNTPQSKRHTYIIPEHVGEEGHHDTVLPRVLLAQGTDGLHNHNLQNNTQGQGSCVCLPRKNTGFYLKVSL